MKWGSLYPKQIAITEDIVDLMADNHLSVRFVGSKSFQKLINRLEPAYSLPCRQTFSKVHIPKRCEVIRSHIKQLIGKASNVCTTVDIWTSRQQKSFMGVTCHMIVEGVLETVMLACRPMVGSHTAEHVKNIYCEVVEDYSLENKVSAIVTDNASNMVKAFGIPGYEAQTGKAQYYEIR